MLWSTHISGKEANAEVVVVECTLIVFSNARQVDNLLNIMLLQNMLGPNSGPFKKCWGPKGTSRYYHKPRCTSNSNSLIGVGMNGGVKDVFNSNCSIVPLPQRSVSIWDRNHRQLNSKMIRFTWCPSSSFKFLLSLWL
jgi:hypothetical protein